MFTFLTIMFVVLALLVLLAFFSPFPYWRTYFYLWKILLFHNRKGMTLKAKINQAQFLLKSLFLSPVFTIFWYIDELFYPAYKKVAVSPVFIIGQPRCGTTFLHRTLAADSSTFLAIRHIEWRYPFISMQKLINTFGFTKNLLKRSYWPSNSAGNIAAKMHPNLLSDWEEDGIFFEECLLHHFFIFLRFPYPELLNYLDDFNSLTQKSRDKFLDFHERTIKKMKFLHNAGDKHYLSKEVTSHTKIPYLMSKYPSARIIVCVRKSKDFMNSLLPLVTYSTQVKNHLEPKKIEGWEECFTSRMEKDCQLLLTTLHCTLQSELQTRVTYNQLMDNLIPTITHIYTQNEFTMSANYLDYLEAKTIDQKSRHKGYRNRRQDFYGFEEYDKFVDSVNYGFMETTDLKN